MDRSLSTGSRRRRQTAKKQKGTLIILGPPLDVLARDLPLNWAAGEADDGVQQPQVGTGWKVGEKRGGSARGGTTFYRQGGREELSVKICGRQFFGGFYSLFIKLSIINYPCFLKHEPKIFEILAAFAGQGGRPCTLPHKVSPQVGERFLDSQEGGSPPLPPPPPCPSMATKNFKK